MHLLVVVVARLCYLLNILRPIRLILAAYVLVWFTMVVPSHTRGVVTVPGKNASVAAQSSSCCHSSSSTDDTRGKPTREQAKRCAVCFVASALSTPVVYVVDVRPIDRIGVVACLAHAQVRSNDFPNPYWPTGPPATL